MRASPARQHLPPPDASRPFEQATWPRLRGAFCWPCVGSVARRVVCSHAKQPCGRASPRLQGSRSSDHGSGRAKTGATLLPRSLAWLAGVALLFTNSALTEGWMVDFAALVALGLAAIWAIWWLIRGSVLR